MTAAARLTVTHERTARFRVWGIFELVLKVLAFIILIPLWIYLLFESASDSADGGDSSTSRTPKHPRKRYRHSSFFTYHHEIVVRTFGADDLVLDEARTRVESPAHGEQLLATVLADAASKRLVVTETVDVNPGRSGPLELSHLWYGGRPLMVSRALRGAEGLEPQLKDAGFEVDTEDGTRILRRTIPPASFWFPFIVIGCFALLLGAVVVGLTPFSLVVAVPLLVLAAIINRHEFGELLFSMFCALLRLPERFELRVTGTTVRFSHAQAWRRRSGSTEGTVLVAIGFGGALGPEPRVDRAPAAIRVYGEKASLVIPPHAVEGAGPLVHEWLASTLVSNLPAGGAHDFRTACTHCGTLWDIEQAERCPSCGAPAVAEHDGLLVS